MPGAPKGVRLSMRFRVQYRAADGRRGPTSRTPTRAGASLGAAKGAAAESGWTFSFARPAKAGDAARRRAFRWRRGDDCRAAEVATEAGHRSSAGADPAGYSAATCALALSRTAAGRW